MSPVRRAARLIRLLREEPRQVGELPDLLGVSTLQVYRDLQDIGAEWSSLRRQGGGPHTPRLVWIDRTVEPARVG